MAQLNPGFMKTNYITKSNVWRLAGMLGTPFWTFAFILSLVLNHDSFIDEILPICLICVPFIVASILMTMMSFLWYIKVDEEKVAFRNMFGFTKTYENSELTMIIKHYKRKGTQKFYIYKDKKKITTVTIYDTNFTAVSKFKNRETEKLKQK